MYIIDNNTKIMHNAVKRFKAVNEKKIISQKKSKKCALIFLN